MRRGLDVGRERREVVIVGPQARHGWLRECKGVRSLWYGGEKGEGDMKKGLGGGYTCTMAVLRCLTLTIPCMEWPGTSRVGFLRMTGCCKGYSQISFRDFKRRLLSRAKRLTHVVAVISMLARTHGNKLVNFSTSTTYTT